MKRACKYFSPVSELHLRLCSPPNPPLHLTLLTCLVYSKTPASSLPLPLSHSLTLALFPSSALSPLVTSALCYALPFSHRFTRGCCFLSFFFRCSFFFLFFPSCFLTPVQDMSRLFGGNVDKEKGEVLMGGL